MRMENVWRKFETLPPAAQKEVIDFIDFLQSRYVKTRNKAQARNSSFAGEEFVGIWQEREDMTDSSQWVKNLRRSEWKL